MLSSPMRAAWLAACLAVLAVQAAASPAASMRVSDALARIPLSSLSDDTAPPHALPRGPVLLQFWASWCGSCSGLMWELDRLSAAHSQVAYRAISIDSQRSDALRITSSPLFARHPRRYLQDATGGLARHLSVQAVPTLVLLDATGREAWRHVGHVNSADLQRLRRAMAALPIDSTPTEEPRP